MKRVGAGALLAAIAMRAVAESPPPDAAEREARLRDMQQQILGLRVELERFEGRERGVLGELERLDAAARLRDAELQEAIERLEATREAIGERTRRLERIDASQRERRRYLAFRLREIYKRGPAEALRRLLEGDDAQSYLAGLRVSTYLAERDARTLRAYREDAARIEVETEALRRARERWAAVREEAERGRAELLRARARRASHLASIQNDRRLRQRALEELESASSEIRGLAGGTGGPGLAGGLDVSRFRGLLEWPVAGRVSAGFGQVVHPRFRTVVPHPGLDIEAPAGTDFRAVFEGQVAYASWLRGYGLTAIVDHGGGVASVYAHASVLLVEKGQRVSSGQRLGKVGDTGSLRGPYLYFELRQDGKPVDPIPWLRRR